MQKRILILLTFLFAINAKQDISFHVNEHLKTFLRSDTTGSTTTPFLQVTAPNSVSKLKKREYVSKVFFDNQFSELNAAQVSSIINNNFPSDLNLFTDSETCGNLFSKLNRTTTVFGEINLIRELLSPTNDINKLNQSQNFVRELTNNEQALAKVEQELQKIHENEDAFLTLFETDAKEVQDLFYKRPGFKFLNNNAYAASTANNTITALNWAFVHAVSIPEVVSKDEYKVDTVNLQTATKKTVSVISNFIKYNLNPKKVFIDPFINLYKSHEIIEKGRDELRTRLQDLDHTEEQIKKELKIFDVASIAGVGISGLVSTYMVYLEANFYRNEYNRRKVINKLQTKLVKITNIFKSLENIRNILETELNIKLSEFKLDKDAENLLSELKKSTFNGQSIIYFEGQVLSTYYKIKEHKEKLANLFIQIGIVDSYASIAKLAKENNLCFVEFIKSSNPQIVTNNFWNLFIDKNSAVANNLPKFDRNIILSGANAGGKSTTIKSILQNLLLGQTFGVATGSEFSFTPFKQISSYLNIVDDIGAGQSLFKAEVARAKEMLKSIDSLNTYELGFCAIDELFTGTAAEAGERCAKELVNKLIMKDNSQFIFATHYQKLTDLEKEIPERVENYMMNPPVIVKGKLKYPFTIKKGINTVNVAQHILEEEKLI